MIRDIYDLMKHDDKIGKDLLMAPLLSSLGFDPQGLITKDEDDINVKRTRNLLNKKVHRDCFLIFPETFPLKT